MKALVQYRQALVLTGDLIKEYCTSWNIYFDAWNFVQVEVNIQMFLIVQMDRGNSPYSNGAKPSW